MYHKTLILHHVFLPDVGGNDWLAVVGDVANILGAVGGRLWVASEDVIRFWGDVGLYGGGLVGIAGLGDVSWLDERLCAVGFVVPEGFWLVWWLCVPARLLVAGFWGTAWLWLAATLVVSRSIGFGALGVVGFLPITSANEINFNCFWKDSDLNTAKTEFCIEKDL